MVQCVLHGVSLYKESLLLRFCDFISCFEPYLKDEKSYIDFLVYFTDLVIDKDKTEENPFDEIDNSFARKIVKGEAKFPVEKARFLLAEDKFYKTQFEDEIFKIPKSEKAKIVEALNKFGTHITLENLEEKASQLYLEIISDIASGKKESIATSQNAGQKDLEQKYGLRLLQECKNSCPCPNCSTSLYIKKGEESQPYFQIIQINPKTSNDRFANLLAVCPACAQKFEIEKTQDDILTLAEIKQRLQENEEIQEIANSEKIDTELANLINNILNATETELEKLKYNPVEVKEKFLPEEHLLKDEIIPRVAKYYNFISEKLKQKVETKNFNENKFRRSVKRLYEDLEEKGIGKTKIFEAISERFYNITNDNFTACQILTSYFVQSCEIFSEIKTEKLEKE